MIVMAGCPPPFAFDQAFYMDFSKPPYGMGSIYKKTARDLCPGRKKTKNQLTFKPFGNLIPINHIEKGFYIVGAPVLILQIISVFPHVYS